MPKVKTKKVVSKRFKVTKTGKIMRGRQMGRHLRLSKNKSQKRKYKEPIQIKGQMKKVVRTFIPYD